MAYSNSGDRDATDGVASRHIPALAIAAVGLLQLYAVTLLFGINRQVYAIEWCLALLLLTFCARAVLADYGYWVRMGLFLFFAVGIPCGIIIMGVTARSGLLTVHAFVLFALCMSGWKLLEPVVEQCTGCTRDTAPRPRTRAMFVPEFPFIRTFQTVEPGGMAFTGDALMTLLIAGAVLFSGGEFLRLNRGLNGIMPALPFALAFFLLVGGLISLSKLVQRVRETPGTVRLEPGFIKAWAGVMLVVLVVCGALALLLPKQPVVGSGRWVVNEAQARTRDLHGNPGQQPSVTSPPSTPTRWRSPFGGQGNQPAGGAQGTPGNTKAIPDQGHGPSDRAIQLLQDAATAFEKDAKSPGAQGGEPASGKSGNNGKTPGKGESTQSTGGKGGEGSSNAMGNGTAKPGDKPKNSGKTPTNDTTGKDNPSAKPDKTVEKPGATPSKQPPDAWQQLLDTLKNRPDRMVKLALIVLGVLGVTVGLVLLLVAAVRRHVWYILVGLWQAIAEWGGALLSRWLGPWRERARLRRREAQIALIMSSIQPYEDPFARAETHGNLPGTLYDAFQAQLYLLGYERKPAETSFAFATRMVDVSGLEEKALWEITMGCVRTEFSPTPLSPGDLTQLKDAYARLTDAIATRLPADVLAERQRAYRRLLAERQVDRVSEEPRTASLDEATSSELSSKYVDCSHAHSSPSITTTS